MQAIRYETHHTHTSTYLPYEKNLFDSRKGLAWNERWMTHVRSGLHTRKYLVSSPVRQIPSENISLPSNRTTSQQSRWYTKWVFNSLLSVKKLTEKSHRRAEAGDEVMMVKSNRVYWTILVAYVSMFRLRLTSTNSTCTVIPKLLHSIIP